MAWEEVTVMVQVTVDGDWARMVAVEAEEWLPSGHDLNTAAHIW